MTSDSLCLHERFERQVAATPDGVALTFAGEHLTYRALNERANRLAAYLRDQGVGPERRVGLCLDRSLDTVVAILAVLKAGGAYVPMDPIYPAERVRMIVEDAECPVVLAHAAHADRFVGEGGATRIILDGADRPWEDGPGENLPTNTTRDSLAYVIYTSGSTGRPKGALISHWNVYRLVTEMEPWFDVGPADVWTLFHSYAFDFSVWEMWGAFFYGGRLLVVPHLVSRAPDQFYQMLLDEGVTVLNQTPSAFKQLQHHDETVPLEKARGLALRYVIFGGETLDMPGLAPWFDRHGDQKPHLVNMYGITETTVFVTYRPVSIADTQPGTPNFIGIPIPDLTLYILDEHRKPVGVGDVGELFVGGDGVGQGYLKRPELTAERFVPDPLASDSAGAAMFYKTGDLVRVWEGDLEFLGRNDMQVQLRGFRVELGEIETALNLHPEVRGAVVRMREDTPGDQRLAAYYLAREPVPVQALREHLGTTLPQYMIPAAFVHMVAFPLNNNGKIDAAALPAPTAGAASDADYVAPETPVEQQLAALWQAVLGVSRVGREDNLFQLGGHSLLVTQLLVRIRQQFGVDLPLRLVMEQPTIAAHARAIEAVLDTGDVRACAEALPAADRARPVPLSFAQERLWIIEQLDHKNTAYNIPILFEISGEVDIDRLRAALDAVVARHEVLRTVFREAGGATAQVVLPDLKIPFSVEAIPPNTTAGEGSTCARAALSEASRVPMPLDTGPLARFVFYDSSPRRNFLGLVVHHAVFDGWSISVLLNDLAASYAALTEGRDGALPPLDRQYIDYTRWQRDRFDRGAMQGQLDYWKKQLEGPLPVLELPVDFPRPPRQTWAGAVATAQVDERGARALEHLALDQRKTLFTVLLAAWQLLLHRYAGQEDILTGTAIAGRNHPDLEPMIGFFVNTVVLRNRLADDTAFPDYLQAVEATVIDAQENQDVPFDRVVAEVHRERDPSRSPLFQVMFILHNTPRYEVAFAGMAVAGEEIGNGAAKFDLTLAVQPHLGGLQLNLEYNTALYAEATAERMLRNYQALLDSILNAPQAPLGRFQLVDDAERALLLDTWTDTAAPLDRAQSLAALFEARVAAHPEAIAVADDHTAMTYGELDRCANQLAHFLIDRGVAREEPVPFFLARTVRTMVAIIGILKAGAAYVPLDLLDPPGRRERVLSVLSPRMILTEAALHPQLVDAGVPLVSLDEGELLRDCPAASPGIPVAGADLAYVIFTSGSTGNPKGVCCTHQGVINLYQDLQARLPVGPGDACSIWTAFSFDVSVYESWTSLLAGAALHIIPERVRANPDQCLTWLRDRHVVTGYIPGFMLPVLAEFQRRDPVPFRRLLVGVEPLPEALLCDIVASTPGLVLLNLYGPTEAAIYVTLYTVEDRHPRPKGNAPIGKAIQNTRIYVLDPAGNPVPVGVPGELYIGGVGLARGYYNDPELTARQFVPDPFSTQDTRRLYRTGDLVFFKPDGNIQFIRRMGRYIKLRGYRIEPGEIESVLRTHPQVDDAVVSVYGEDPTTERLIAHIVTADPPALDDRQLATYLESELPAHMRPAQYVFMAALPRTVQGKLDRKMLPAPARPDGSAATAVPVTVAEIAMAALWRTALQVDTVGRNDNFFSLGGNSLLAIQFISRLGDEFGVELSLGDLLDYPTLTALAALVERRRQGGREEGPDRRELFQLKAGEGAPFFCASGAGDVLGSYAPLAQALREGQPFYCFSDRLLDLSESDDFTIESMAANFVSHIRSVKPSGPYILGGYSFGGVLAFEAAKQLLEAGEAVSGVIMLDTSAALDGTEARQLSLRAARHWARRLLVRAWATAYTWKLQIGYVRDIVPVLRHQDSRPAPRLKECLQWIWYDTLNQYFMMHAGLYKARIGDRRLEMIRETTVQQTTRRVALMSAAQQAYAYTPIPTKIVVIRVAHDPWREARLDETLGWRQFAAQGVDVHVIPGNHFVMHREPFVRELGQCLQQNLDTLAALPQVDNNRSTTPGT